MTAEEGSGEETVMEAETAGWWQKSGMEMEANREALGGGSQNESYLKDGIRMGSPVWMGRAET